MLARPARGETLDRVDEDGRRRNLDALRPDEQLGEPPRRLLALRVAPGHDVAEPPDVLVERLRHLDEPAADLPQVAVVEHAALRRGELGDGDRVDGLADDARLDHRARVHAEDDRAVVDRVEVVGARRPPRPATRPLAARATTSSTRSKSTCAPLLVPVRMRPDQDARVAQRGLVAGAHRLDPLAGRTRPRSSSTGTATRPRRGCTASPGRARRARRTPPAAAAASRTSGRSTARRWRPRGRPGRRAATTASSFCVSFQTVTRSGSHTEQLLARQVVPAGDADAGRARPSPIELRA